MYFQLNIQDKPNLSDHVRVTNVEECDKLLINWSDEVKYSWNRFHHINGYTDIDEYVSFHNHYFTTKIERIFVEII